MNGLPLTLQTDVLHTLPLLPHIGADHVGVIANLRLPPAAGTVLFATARCFHSTVFSKKTGDVPMTSCNDPMQSPGHAVLLPTQAARCSTPVNLEAVPSIHQACTALWSST